MDNQTSVRELALEYDKKHSENSFEEQYYKGKRDPATGVLAIFIIIFVFFALLFWAGLAIGKPSWCLTPTAGLDNGKAFGAALIIAFFVLIVIAIIWSFVGGINNYNNGKGLWIALIVILILIVIFAIAWAALYYTR